MELFFLCILYICAYLIGAIPTAYIIGRLIKGIDIRKYGSGNVGGSNVFYHVGKIWIVPLGLFELFVKGGLPIWIGHYFLGLEGGALISKEHYIGFGKVSPALVGVALVAIAGHNWSAFLKFSGGRGIAVAIGVLFALAPKELGAFILVALGGWLIFRSSAIWIYVSLLLLPFWSLLFREPLAIAWLCVGILGLVTMKRLLSNWTPLPQGVPLKKGLVNRLLKDRDIDQREEWVYKVPQVSNQISAISYQEKQETTDPGTKEN